MLSDRELVLELLEKERKSLSWMVELIEEKAPTFSEDPDVKARVDEWRGRVLHCERLIMQLSFSEGNPFGELRWATGEVVWLEVPGYHTAGGQRYVEVFDEDDLAVALVAVDEGCERSERDLRKILLAGGVR